MSLSNSRTEILAQKKDKKKCLGKLKKIQILGSYQRDSNICRFGMGTREYIFLTVA